MNNNYCLP